MSKLKNIKKEIRNLRASGKKEESYVLLQKYHLWGWINPKAFGILRDKPKGV